MNIPLFPLSTRLARCTPLCAIAMLCMLSTSTQAAGSGAAVAIHTVKTQLLWLRDITMGGVMPVYAPARGDEYAGLSRNAEGRLFKPLRAGTHANAPRLSASQLKGVQLSDRTQLHYDFSRYHTVDDQREIGVKVGINIGFR